MTDGIASCWCILLQPNVVDLSSVPTPILCLVVSDAPLCLELVVCLLTSLCTANTTALAASYAAYAITIFIASVSAISCFCFHSSKYYIYWFATF